MRSKVSNYRASEYFYQYYRKKIPNLKKDMLAFFYSQLMDGS